MARLFDDASSEYAEVNDPPVTESDLPFAFSCWIRTDNTAGREAIMSLSDKDASDEQFWMAIGTVDDGGGGVADGDTLVCVERAEGTFRTATSGSVTANTWHHAIGIWASTTDRRAILDNANKGTSTGSGNSTGIDRYSIGRLGDSTPNWYWSGDIAEAAIWKLTGWPGATAAAKADAFEAAAVPALAKGFSPLHFRLGLASYVPMVRDGARDLVRGVNLTLTGTTVSNHPRIIYPRRRILVPVPAAGGGAAFEATPGTVKLGGVVADVILSGDITYEATPGAVKLTGITGDVVTDVRFEGSTGTVKLTGQAGDLVVANLFESNPGLIKLLGIAADVGIPLGFEVTPGAILLSGEFADVVLTGTEAAAATPAGVGRKYPRTVMIGRKRYRVRDALQEATLLRASIRQQLRKVEVQELKQVDAAPRVRQIRMSQTKVRKLAEVEPEVELMLLREIDEQLITLVASNPWL